MGLQKSRMRDVAIHQAIKAVRADVPKYDPDYEILSVTLQPLEGQLYAQLYGLQLNKMLLLLTNEPTSLLPEGAGVCVDVAIDALPDYRVESSKTWARHTVAHLKLVPEGKRGEYGV